jgi:release factor glutamine methyltransferase
MPSLVKRVRFGDKVFNICEDIYEPAEDSFLFAENLDVQKGAEVIDIGTGSGFLAVLAAENAGNVLALDVNPYAVRCARANAALNSVESRIDFIQASLLGALNSTAKFDLILFNAPYLPSEAYEAESWIGRSWAGGVNGREVIDRFITQVTTHLKLGGKVLLMQSTLTGVEETINNFAACNFCASIKAEQKLPFFETLTLIEAKFSNAHQ